MSCQNYKVIEMTNNAVGAVTLGGMMPLGSVTRRISTSTGSGVPFEVAASGSDTIQLTSKGYYKVVYNSSLVVAGAGSVGITLMVNGTDVYTSSVTAAAAGTVSIVLVKDVRVFANCASCSTNCPVNIQFRLSGSSITGGTSVVIVDSCVNG